MYITKFKYLKLAVSLSYDKNIEEAINAAKFYRNRFRFIFFYKYAIFKFYKNGSEHVEYGRI